MPNEIEAKFKVGDFRAVRRRLKELGAVHLGTDLQTDAYYDTPQRKLLNEDKGLRIRHTRRLRSPSTGDKADTRAQLTFKGPAGNHKRAKIRREIQTRIDSHEAMNDVLAALGLAPTLKIQKKRASYRLGACRIELDRLPLIGCFVEIEARGADQIETVAGKLRISSEPSKDHYVNLLLGACRRASSGACQEITFENCANCNSA